MGNFKKDWKATDTYNMVIEINRIEYYNKYVDEWLKNYFKNEYQTLTHKVDWSEEDIIFSLNQFNRIKSNINTLNERLSNLANLSVLTDSGQTLGLNDLQALEDYLMANMKKLGEYQFVYPITNLTYCGDVLKLNIK